MRQQETVYCERCQRHVPLDESVVIDPVVHAGHLSPQLPTTIHVRKHRRCKGRLYLPGPAPVEAHKPIG